MDGREYLFPQSWAAYSDRGYGVSYLTGLSPCVIQIALFSTCAICDKNWAMLWVAMHWYVQFIIIQLLILPSDFIMEVKQNKIGLLKVVFLLSSVPFLVLFQCHLEASFWLLVPLGIVAVTRLAFPHFCDKLFCMTSCLVKDSYGKHAHGFYKWNNIRSNFTYFIKYLFYIFVNFISSMCSHGEFFFVCFEGI